MNENRQNKGLNVQAVVTDRAFDGSVWHSQAAILIEQGRIIRLVGAQNVPVGWPCKRLPEGVFLAPGFIDLQVNGGAGALLNDNPTLDGLRTIARAHRRYGTTGCLPTLISDKSNKLIEVTEASREVIGREGVLGLHLEGPFISPQRPGVHPLDAIRQPAESDLKNLSELGRLGVSVMTLAPECVPRGFIRALVDAGVRVSIGHSEASAEIVDQAIDEGASGVTHLFNAMPPLSARMPGIVGAAFANDRLFAGIIVDGIHVDPVSVRAAFAAKGAERIMLVTDAMPTVGGSLHEFDLMGRTVKLENGRLSTANGTLAGAHLDMASAVRNAVRLCGLSLDEALRAASSTPANFLGVQAERGAIVAGARADLVALTPEIQVFATWIDGQIVEAA